MGFFSTMLRLVEMRDAILSDNACLLQLFSQSGMGSSIKKQKKMKKTSSEIEYEVLGLRWYFVAN